MRALHEYKPQQEDELSLHEGDLINVTRKMADGWYEGENPQSGRIGWFPASYVEEILNDHVRARNYRQRLRMIQVCSSFSLFAVSSHLQNAELLQLEQRHQTYATACNNNNNNMTQTLSKALSKSITNLLNRAQSYNMPINRSMWASPHRQHRYRRARDN